MTTDAEFQLVLQERDDALLERDVAIDIAADAIAIAQRAASGRPVDPRIIKRLRDRLSPLQTL